MMQTPERSRSVRREMPQDGWNCAGWRIPSLDGSEPDGNVSQSGSGAGCGQRQSRGTKAFI